MGSIPEHVYRRKAERYLAAARALNDPAARSSLIDLAARYIELAQQDKHIAALVEEAEHQQDQSAKTSRP
jgi:hypothetical protein